MTPIPDALQHAWQSALAAEHQAVFGYDLLGPRLPTAQQPLARQAQTAHRQLRTAVQESMVAVGLTPVAPLVDYPALYPVRDAAAARRLATHLEDICAGAWRYLYARAATPSPAGAGSTPSPPAPSSPAPSSPAPSSLSAVPGHPSAASAAPPLAPMLRTAAQQQLTASAVRGAKWRSLTTPGQATVAFPGL